MPLYEYQCQECGEKTEVVQRFDAALLTICSSCGGVLRKLISAPAIQFKGSGFYLTDYGRAGSSAAAKNSGSDGSSGSDKSASSDKGSSSESKSSSSDSSSSPSPSSTTKND